MGKILGYVLSLIGILGVVIYTFPEVAAYTGIPTNFIDLTFLIVSVVVVLIGVFLAAKSGSGKQQKEVPIYRGNKIVGYRQH